MEIELIEGDEYSRIFNNPYIPYNTVLFNLLNKHKCDKIEFMLLRDDLNMLGMIAGIQNNTLLCPFSAPFSSFSYTKDNIQLGSVIEAIAAIDGYAIKKGIKEIIHTVPSCFYNQSFISKLIFAFIHNDYKVCVDINHFFDTRDFIKYEKNEIDQRVRCNIKCAINHGLRFTKVSHLNDIRIAYEIIQKNKEAKNRQMRMSYDQLIEMQQLLIIDCFLVYFEKIAIGSAIVYQISPMIVQIIYWGDLPDHSKCRTMNFLAWNVFKYYTDKNISIIDLGISSEKGVPNLGLCDFKERIGCSITTKFTFKKDLMHSPDSVLYNS